MKKTILASLGMVFLLAVAIAPSAKAADSPDWPFLYQEELTAKAIYTQMAETFDNSPYYEKLIKAEDCHAKAIENILARKGMTADANIPAPQVSHDELTALKDAQAYEKTDIANLQTALALTTDAKEQKVLGNQIKASKTTPKA